MMLLVPCLFPLGILCKKQKGEEKGEGQEEAPP
jgi:hypothetical protein